MLLMRARQWPREYLVRGLLERRGAVHDRDAGARGGAASPAATCASTPPTSRAAARRRRAEGAYREASFRETPPELREKYFIEKDGLSAHLDGAASRTSSSRALNLLDRARFALLGAMDVILCRNVIIYFDLETKKRVIDTFADEAAPGGFLLLGHAESLINLSSAFELRHLRNDMVYRKPLPRRAPSRSVARGARRRAATLRGQRGGAMIRRRPHPRAGDRRLGVQPADDHAHARALAAGRGGGRRARRRRGAAQGARARARPDHARPRDAAHGRLHLPAPADGAKADAGDRGERARRRGGRLQGARARRGRLRRQADAARGARAGDDRAGAAPQGARDPRAAHRQGARAPATSADARDARPARVRRASS